MCYSDNMTYRIGFACKWTEIGPKGPISVPELNNSTTTVAWLKRQTKDIAEEKLWDLAINNIESVYRLVEKVGTLDEHLKMVRIGSDILPVYTEPNFGYFYHRQDVQNYIERRFADVGEIARANNVRLSFHPGQFCVLASDNDDIVQRSIEEFEYHVDMIRWMGFGQQFQDFKCNVHIAGRQGPEGIRKVLGKLSPEARNTITIENEENKYGLDECLELGDILPIVLDLHHHWVHSGEYISPGDDRVKKVLDSWRGVRPTCHYSVSREDLMTGHPNDIMPDMSLLLSEGYKKQKLRAHSDYYWNTKVNQWALRFLDDFDIMCESKCKNLASKKLYDQYLKMSS
jgi:UV DNA damage endonuclease